jgi:hypothetical protein
MFGSRLDPPGPSTLGGRLFESGEATARGMVYGYGPAGEPPFLRSDNTVRSEPLGSMTSRCLGPGATEALAALSAVRTAAVLSGGQDSPRSRRSYRSLQTSMDPDLAARLARLGIGARDPDLERGRWPRVVDMPLG